MALALAALAASAEPAYELWTPWFGCDAVRGVTNGVTCASASDGRTLVPLTPLPAASAAVLEVTCVFSQADVGAARELVACRDDVQLSLCVASTARARLAFFAWTADGWVELSGAEPAIDAAVVLRLELDYASSPAVVRLYADGEPLAAADSSRCVAFPLAAAAAHRCGTFVIGGAIGVPVASAVREQVDNVAAVVRDDRVVGYYATLDAARAAAGTGRIVLLRPTTLTSPDALAGETVIHEAVLARAMPALTVSGDASRLERDGSVIILPQGWTGDAPLLAPASSNVLAAVHVHGDEGVPYALYPSGDALRVRRDGLNLDGGAFTAFLSVPENGRSFLRGLRDGTCGSENALYVNGTGSLTLCGTNLFSGSVFVESSALRDAGVLRSATVGVLSRPVDVTFALSDRGGESPAAVEGDGRVVLENVTDELAGQLSVRFDPGAGRVGYLTRAGDTLVARVAAASTFAAEDGFAAAADAQGGAMHLTARIDNAVSGFRYGWLAADSASGPFEPVGETVDAKASGLLEVKLVEPPAEARFYRIKVEAPQ